MKDLDKILEQRQSRYGEFDQLAIISQSLKEKWYMTQNCDFDDSTDTMNEAKLWKWYYISYQDV